MSTGTIERLSTSIIVDSAEARGRPSAGRVRVARQSKARQGGGAERISASVLYSSWRYHTLLCVSLSRRTPISRAASCFAGPSSSVEGLEELLDLIGEGTEAGGADGVRTGRVPAEALAGHGIGER